MNEKVLLGVSAAVVGAAVVGTIVANRNSKPEGDVSGTVFDFKKRKFFEEKRDSLSGRLIDAQIKSRLVRMGLKPVTKLCSILDSPITKPFIPGFIKSNDIDWTLASKCQDAKDLKDCASRFKSLDDFFTRNVINTPKLSYDNSKVVAPATARTHYFRTVDHAKQYWIKGKRFDLDTLVDGITPTAKFKSIMISRLAPADYHQFHAPMSGTLITMKEVKGSNLSVDPKIVANSNVFTENQRVIMLFKNHKHTWIYIAVGATCVSSVEIFVNVGDTVAAGQKVGQYRFGGSTNVTLFDGYIKNPTLALKVMKKHSQQSIETLVEVGTLLGKLSDQ